MTILLIVLGFAMGFFTAFCWQQHRWKKAEKAWMQQQRQRQEKMERELSLARERASTAEQATQTLSQKNRLIRSQLKKERVLSISSQQPQNGPAPTEKEKKPDIRQTFRAVESLKLQFQYLLPDSLILQTGDGYLRNAQNELIPGPDTFSGVNSTVGYAMEGLFYLYNVVSAGKEYTFQQIMDGEMGNGYVCIRSVIEPARVVKVGEAGYYGLAAKGKLWVANMG